MIPFALFAAPRVDSLVQSARRSVGPLLLLAMLAGCAQSPPADAGPAPIATELQGYWETSDGADTSSVTIQGDSLYFYARPDHQYDTTITLVPGTDPQQFQATILDSPRTSGSEGEVVWVVYELESEKLTMVLFSEANGAPPIDEAPERYEFERVRGPG